MYSRKSEIGRALSKNPIEEFNFVVLSEVSVDKLDEYELGWINLLGSTHPNGFNMATTLYGQKNVTSTVTRKRLSANTRGYWGPNLAARIEQHRIENIEYEKRRNWHKRRGSV